MLPHYDPRFIKEKKKKKGVGMEEVVGDRKRVCVFSEGTHP